MEKAGHHLKKEDKSILPTGSVLRGVWQTQDSQALNMDLECAEKYIRDTIAYRESLSTDTNIAG